MKGLLCMVLANGMDRDRTKTVVFSSVLTLKISRPLDRVTSPALSTGRVYTAEYVLLFYRFLIVGTELSAKERTLTHTLTTSFGKEWEQAVGKAEG
jgi:predicted DNA-binding helix-hairpin-helix protein